MWTKYHSPMLFLVLSACNGYDLDSMMQSLSSISTVKQQCMTTYFKCVDGGLDKQNCETDLRTCLHEGPPADIQGENLALCIKFAKDEKTSKMCVDDLFSGYSPRFCIDHMISCIDHEGLDPDCSEGFSDCICMKYFEICVHHMNFKGRGFSNPKLEYLTQQCEDIFSACGIHHESGGFTPSPPCN